MKLKDTEVNGNLYVTEDIQLSDISLRDKLDSLTQTSNPNLLINGNFQVWQRGQGFDISSGAGYHYTADRWAIYYDGINSVCNRVDDGLEFHSANNTHALTQILEHKLNTKEYYTLSAMIDGEIHKMTFLGGAYCDSDCGRLKYSMYEGTDYEKIEIKPIGVTTVSWVKLEQGKLNTPCVPRIFTDEVATCVRFYNDFNPTGGPHDCRIDAAWYNSVGGDGGFILQPEMRIKPTVLFSDVQYYLPADSRWHNATSIVTETPYRNANQFWIQITTDGSHTVTPGDSCLIMLILKLDAEIY